MIKRSGTGEAGDLISVTGAHVGDMPRRGEILEVIGHEGSHHYRVQWDDGSESIYYPSNDATVHTRPPEHRRRRPPAGASSG
jgi:hypothetical protein